MKFIVFTFFLFICSSSCKEKKDVTLLNDKNYQSEMVNIGDNIKFNWIEQTGEIGKDSLFHIIKENYPINRNLIIRKIEDTTATKFKLCGSKDILLNGHLAFILVNEIESISYSEDLNVYFDSYSWGCRYSNQLPGYVNNNKTKIIKKLLEINYSP